MNEERTILLDLHNVKRALHHAPKLVHSDACAKTAQEYADYLLKMGKFEHGNLVDANGKKVGQNLARSSNKNWDIKKAVNSWYAELDQYDFSKPGFSHSAGHFTQVVWKNTTHVGFGIARGEKGTIVCANYWPPGNIKGQYETNVSNL